MRLEGLRENISGTINVSRVDLLDPIRVELYKLNYCRRFKENGTFQCTSVQRP